jgi:sterol desaturase/sphingolipid hydroxylase (fatty acid hydroxylase superfamily)
MATDWLSHAVLISASVGLFHDLFSHSNLAVPAPLDRALRMLVVAPDMHRIHHSADQAESDRNFASFFPWWDRLFGT